ncbi:MAG: MFS transporter [Alphaproteobacteria bacterium]|nr:MFS transporter [Alphaproteobacteria bacterium]
MTDRRAILSWCFYDWANSAYPTVITTFIFGTYFTQAVAETPELGTASLGRALAIAAVVVAMISPILGSIADREGARKPWLAVFTVACILATAMLWFVKPANEWALWALVFISVSSVAFEFGMVFYNTMLPELAPTAMIGRVSGWGWGLGYVGGLLCLVVALFGFVETESPWFGIAKAEAANVRATVLLVAVWFLIFAVPLFLFAPDRPSKRIAVATAIRDGFETLVHTARKARNFAGIVRFLVARMFYADGLVTLFSFGGIYAAGTFGMSLAEVIQFGIGLNVTAGLGAMAFAGLDDRIGAKRVIVISLVALIFFSSAILAVESKALFWALGLGLGIFVGPVQAASRSMMARLSPEDMHAEMFGLYAFSGKATAFLGPLALGWATVQFDSQRAGMATIVVLLGLGLVLVLGVREPAH